MQKSKIDLSQLALERSGSAESSARTLRPRRWFSRYVLPVAILLGFVALLAAAGGRQWLPAPSVTVTPVIVKRTSLQRAGTALFQAPGWIEPRPTAIAIASLAPGVIEDLLVVEGQYVEAQEPIAQLIAIDAELELEQAQNLLAIREGELNRAKAEYDAARVRLDNPVHLQVQLADAQSSLAKALTELAKLPFLIEAAKAKDKFAADNVERLRAAGDAVAGRMLLESESEYAAAHAEVQELQQRGPNLNRETEALQDKVDAIEKQLRLLIEETRQLNEAEAKVQSTTALRDEAKLNVRKAKLTLDRNTIRAPVAGRILRLVAAPGMRVMGLDTTAGQSSSTVVEMYDPARLQVRADVRLEDVPMVTRGQPVKIETASSNGVIQGRVLQATSSANIQKNTLEVKVELIDPPTTVSPEMLVSATFLALRIEHASNEATETERIFVPQQLIQSTSSGAFVWIVDGDHIGWQRSVERGPSSGDGLVEIQSGLKVTDKLIASGIDQLTSGRPVVVVGDDQVLGMN
ncbi:HlyD family efflux transporter periplasmic adaptor subunit [Novipirellula artificiosorum]|uniref:Multidrug resistance protein MdtA n=1 Tax=Novipirellula artificiosorum TaxID=2528016 RepID=A0A5C6DH01_9BACT|nr:HlyD family efflux transporter periplasmic adaptor subunit [Novipirellula artificiosorum]TWU34316.1 Multidrug resistance protein MdtA precursor [Novipirellula artificiosorum]